MKICFVADGRSSIAQNWMRGCVGLGHEVHLISTFPCDSQDPAVHSLHTVSLDFSARLRVSKTEGEKSSTAYGSPACNRLRGGLAWRALAHLRDELGPLAVARQKQAVRQIVQQINPDLVHAMRIPFEGILAAQALEGTRFPLLLSVWGNDFTLFAKKSRLVARLTTRALARADGLHPDCRRDLGLACEYGFDGTKPAIVAPGNGGVRADIFSQVPFDPVVAARWGVPAGAPVVVNPRGVKPYIRNDVFFQSIPLVLAKRPDTVFLGAMMEGNALAEGWVRRLGLERSVRLLPYLSPQEMAALFRSAAVTVSPSEHDGTPNTLLEAMACGAFPVAGDIELVREWILPGKNGFLFDPRRPGSLAQAVIEALESAELREEAAVRNQHLVAERAGYDAVMAQAMKLYEQLIRYSHGGDKLVFR